MTVRPLFRSCAVVATGLVVGFAALIAAPAAASAHDDLASSTPKNRAVITALPTKILLTFEEPPAAGYTKVHVFAPSGKDISRGPPVTRGARVSLSISREKVSGERAIRWSVLSDDGASRIRNAPFRS
jgi:methionine-rich copper-binding protein CopC